MFLGAFKLAIEAERQAQAMYSGLKEMSDDELEDIRVKLEKHISELKRWILGG